MTMVLFGIFFFPFFDYLYIIHYFFFFFETVHYTHGRGYRTHDLLPTTFCHCMAIVMRRYDGGSKGQMRGSRVQKGVHHH